MSGVEIRPQEVGAIAGQLADLNQAITARMNLLMSQLSQLHDLWRGPAAQSFHAAKADWERKASQHTKLLADASQGLMETRQTFSMNDEVGGNRIRGIDPSLKA